MRKENGLIPLAWDPATMVTGQIPTDIAGKKI